MGSEARCWCGSTDLTPFSPDYYVCGECGTLVAATFPGPEIVSVDDEERDFYGRRYWFDYQTGELGNPDIVSRARTDLPERCVHWLRTVLGYRLPPARALDVGCGHGAFVMLLARAGFEASGLELSPWVVDFARRTFRVNVDLGPLDAQSLPAGSLDVVTLMDVLEHVTDPEGTVGAALSALADDGLLLIQTPARPPDLSWDDMVAVNHPFLPLMAERGHLYLFTETALRRLLTERLAIPHVRAEPAYFAAYDMFVAASRRPLDRHDGAAVAHALATTADGRLVQALLDLEARWSDLQARYDEVERDRAARLIALLEHGTRLSDAEGARNALSAELQNFRQYLAATEADRAARLAVIREQGERLVAAETDRADRLGLIESLSRRLSASENDRADRLSLIQDLSERLAASEKDRADRLRCIQDLSERLAASDQDRAERLRFIEDLSERLAASDQDRADRLSLIQDLSERLTASEKDRADRLSLIETLSARLAADENRPDRHALVEELRGRLDAAERDRTDRLARLEQLTAELARAEADRAARSSTIEAQGRTLAELDRRLEDLEGERAADARRVHELTAQRDSLAVERNALEGELASLRFRRLRDALRRVVGRRRRVARR